MSEGGAPGLPYSDSLHRLRFSISRAKHALRLTGVGQSFIFIHAFNIRFRVIFAY
jgi:hypothetical protein